MNGSEVTPARPNRSTPNHPQHLPTNPPPILTQVHRPRLNPEPLEPHLGPQRLVAHLRIQQDALVPRPVRPGGLAVPQVREQLVEVARVQLAGAGAGAGARAGAASAGERVPSRTSCPG